MKNKFLINEISNVGLHTMMNLTDFMVIKINTTPERYLVVKQDVNICTNKYSKIHTCGEVIDKEEFDDLNCTVLNKIILSDTYIDVEKSMNYFKEIALYGRYKTPPDVRKISAVTLFNTRRVYDNADLILIKMNAVTVDGYQYFVWKMKYNRKVKEFFYKYLEQDHRVISEKEVRYLMQHFSSQIVLDSKYINFSSLCDIEKIVCLADTNYDIYNTLYKCPYV